MPWRKLVVPSSGSTIQRGLFGIALDLAAFLEQHAPVRAGVAQLLDDRLLGALVGHGDEVGRPLAADLQLLDLAEVAAKARRRLARGALHDGDQAGMGDHRISRRGGRRSCS